MIRWYEFCKFGDGGVDIFRPGPEMIQFTAKVEQNKGLLGGEKWQYCQYADLKGCRCIDKVHGKMFLRYRQWLAGVYQDGWSLTMAS